MEFFKTIFGANREKAPTTAQCILKVRSLKDLLEKKIKFTNEKIIEAQETAENTSVRKTVATQSLNRKIRLEQQVKQLKLNLVAVKEQLKALECVAAAEPANEVKETSSSLTYFVVIGVVIVFIACAWKVLKK